MTGHTDVATANVLRTLPREAARRALRDILALEPDLVGLQEWGVSRHRLLRETGSVRVPGGLVTGRGSSAQPGRYTWVSSPPLLGGCPIGARSDRYQLLDTHLEVVGRLGRVDRNAGPPPVAVPRIVTLAVFRDVRRDRVVSVVNYHLTPRVQARGRYREDRPLLVARHRAEVRRLDRLVGEQLSLGRVVYALGDSNFDGMRLDGLTSAWDGRDDETGTLVASRRKIDDVHGPGRATSVVLLTNDSDHRAVVVRRPDDP
jgi:hypothetical protein